MALTQDEIDELKEYIEGSHRPLIFFDDDCDGLSSFLQVYKYIGEGRGIPVKDSPEVGGKYARKAREYQPDLVLVLDKPYLSDDFVRKVKEKIVWLDHHDPQEPKGNVTYFNPRLHDDDDNRPTSYWIYRALEENFWVAMTGIIADWHFPDDLADEFREEYPGLLPEDVDSPDAAIHDSELGKMTRIWSFNLKGTVRDTMGSVKALTRIDEPEEILEQTTARGKYVYKKYDRMISRYNELLESVEVPDGELLVFTYKDPNSTYTSDLSNEILYRHPDKVIIIGRRDGELVKCSLRSSEINVEQLLQDCLKGVRGRGGGHPQAAGAAIHVDDFDDFVACFRRKLEE